MFLLARVVRHLSLHASLALGRSLGRLVPYLSPRHFRQVRHDIGLAFGETMNKAQILALARESYQRMGEGLIEFLRIPYTSAQEILQRVRVEGTEHLDVALTRGKGIVLQFAHLGNWEYGGTAMGLTNYPMVATMRPQEDSTLTDLLVRIRIAHGLEVIPMSDVRGCMRLLKQNKMVAIAGDLNATVPGAFINFFGHPAATYNGASYLAMSTGAALIPIFSERLPDHTYRIYILPPVPIEQTGNRKHDLFITTLRMQRIIEKEVARRPADWYWLLQRWKTTPEEIPHPELVPMEHRDLSPEEVAAALTSPQPTLAAVGAPE